MRAYMACAYVGLRRGQAQAVLQAVHVPGMPAGLTQREKLHVINTMISLSCECQV